MYSYTIKTREVGTTTEEETNVGGTANSPWAAAASPQFNLQTMTTITWQYKKQYQFKVKAINDMGHSAYSGWTSSADGYGFLLAQPAATSALNIGSPPLPTSATENMIEWLPLNSEALRGGEIEANMEYRIYADQVDGNQANNYIATVNGAACNVAVAVCTYTHTGLTTGDTWYYTLGIKNRGYLESAKFSPRVSTTVQLVTR